MGVRNHQKFVSLALTLLMVGAMVGTTGAVAGADGPTTESNERSFETLEPAATVTIEGTFTRLKSPDGNEYVPIEGAYAQLIAEKNGQREQVAVQQLDEDGTYSFDVTDREVYYDYYGADFYVTVYAANDAARIVDPARLASTASSEDDVVDNQPGTAPRDPVEVTAHSSSAQRATALPPETHDESSDVVCNYENSGNATGALWAMRTDRVQAYYASHLEALEGEWRPPAEEDYNYSGAFSALEEMHEMYTVLSSINESTATWPGQRQVPVRWPADDTKFSGRGYAIHIQDDSGHDAFRDTVQHEYGHGVMWDLYTAGRYPNTGLPNRGVFGRISPHNPYKLANPEFALLEGWAEFVPNAVDRSATYRAYTTFDVESTNFYEEVGDRYDEPVYGSDSEGAVLNVLYDVADDESFEDDTPGVDDDGIDGRFEAIWRIMKLDNPDNITHFRSLWRERGYGQNDELDAIYRRHGIPSTEVPWINVTGVDAPRKVEPGDEFTIYVEVRNRPGSETTGTETVTLSVGNTTLGPEEVTVEPGTTERVAFNWTFDEFGEYQVESHGKTATINVTDIEEPEVYARNVTTNDSTVEVGETVVLTVTYENVGDGEKSVELLPTIDGEPTVGVFPDRATIEPGETTTETITWSFDEPGTYEMGAGDTVETDTTTVVVVNESDEADVRVTGATLNDSTITAGEAVTTSATVENVGDAEGTTTVDLVVDGTVVDSREVTLAAGGITTVAFQRTFDQAGTYDVAVGGAAAGTLTVEESTDTCTMIQAVAAFDSDPTTISYSDYSTAYEYYYYGEPVPDTGGETISYSQLGTIYDYYETGQTVEPCQ